MFSKLDTRVLHGLNANIKLNDLFQKSIYIWNILMFWSRLWVKGKDIRDYESRFKNYNLFLSLFRNISNF